MYTVHLCTSRWTWSESLLGMRACVSERPREYGRSTFVCVCMCVIGCLHCYNYRVMDSDDWTGPPFVRDSLCRFNWFLFLPFCRRGQSENVSFYFFFNLFLTAFVFLFGTSFLVVGQLSDHVTDGRDECHDSRALTSITRAPLFSLGWPFVESPFFFSFYFWLGLMFPFFLFLLLYSAAWNCTGKKCLMRPFTNEDVRQCQTGILPFSLSTLCLAISLRACH